MKSRGLDGEMARALANRSGECSANSRPFDSADAPLKVTEEVIVIPSAAAGVVEESRRSKSLQAVQVVWNMSSRCRRITVGVFVVLIAPIKKKRRRSSPSDWPREPQMVAALRPSLPPAPECRGKARVSDKFYTNPKPIIYIIVASLLLV